MEMDNGSVEVRYYEEIDVMVIKLRRGKPSDTIKLANDVFAILDEKKNIIEIEIWRASDLVIKALSNKMVGKAEFNRNT